MNRRNFLKKSLFSSIALALSPMALKKQTPKPPGFFIGDEKNFIKSDGETITVQSDKGIELKVPKDQQSRTGAFFGQFDHNHAIIIE